MNIRISGHHLDLTPALQQYVNEKIGKLERHFDKIDRVQIILRVEKERQIAEARVQMVENSIQAHAEASDMYAAIDLLSHRLDRQVRRHKDKVRGHSHEFRAQRRH